MKNNRLLERVSWRELDETARERVLARSTDGPSRDIADSVKAIRDEVAARGDAALFDLTARFDGVELSRLSVSPDEIARATEAMDSEDRACLLRAKTNIETFHELQKHAPLEVETAPGVRCWRVSRPIERVGLYVPGGTAPLVSTLLMLAVPAAIAGCGERILCTPPGPDGRVADVVLAAAAMCEVTAVFRVGGAQAVAALALGTESVPRVDKIFGPGNAYVAAAKQLVASEPGGPAVDLPAGPSEVLVIADDSADPDFVAADLLSQAEHDTMARVVLVTPSEALADRVDERVERQLETLPRRDIAAASLRAAVAVVVADLDEALSVSNAYAPEHLILNCAEASKLVERVLHAGSVFVGPWTPEALGDYASGTNHVLPTGGAARAYGGLGLQSFSKSMTVQQADAQGIRTLGPTVERLASLEGLDAHARSVKLRRQALTEVTG